MNIQHFLTNYCKKNFKQKWSKKIGASSATWISKKLGIPHGDYIPYIR